MESYPGLVEPIGSFAAPCDERWVEVEPGVSLRVLSWSPAAPTAPPLLFVAGWVSVIEGWAPLLEVLVRRQPVWYLETREKRSARIASDRLRVESFAIPRLAEDLVAAAALLALPRDELVLFGSSMGSNAIIEALKGCRFGCRAAFVIGPNAEFAFPWWGKLLTRMPTAGYGLALRVVLWNLRHRRVNSRADPEQMARYERTLRAADPLRLKLSARAVLDYRVWDRLDTVLAPVAIGYAANDTLHGGEDIRAIAAAMPRGETVCCPTNTYMHTPSVVRELDDFVGGCG